MSKETVYSDPDGIIHLYRRNGVSAGEPDIHVLEIGGWECIIEEIDYGHPLYGPKAVECSKFIEEVETLAGHLDKILDLLDPQRSNYIGMTLLLGLVKVPRGTEVQSTIL